MLIEEAIARAFETAHPLTLANAYWYKASLEALRGDAAGALHNATRVIELSREHEIGHYLALGMVYFDWARARRSDSSNNEIDVAELRKGIAALTASRRRLAASSGTEGGRTRGCQGRRYATSLSSG